MLELRNTIFPISSNTAKVSTNDNSDDASVNSCDDEVGVDIIKLFDITSSQNQYNEPRRTNRLFVPTEKYLSYTEEDTQYSSYVEETIRVPKSQRSLYLDQQARYARNKYQERKEK